MARRRTRSDDPPKEDEPVQEVSQTSAADDDEEMEDQPEQRRLQFKEELSWRPAKPIPSATLLNRLEKLSKELADFDQEAVVLDSLNDVAAQLAHRNLLQHKDRGVKAYTACCLVDLLRLFAPDAPFTDDQLKVAKSL